jgi:hypothetical protein
MADRVPSPLFNHALREEFVRKREVQARNLGYLAYVLFIWAYVLVDGTLLSITLSDKTEWQTTGQAVYEICQTQPNVTFAVAGVTKSVVCPNRNDFAFIHRLRSVITNPHAYIVFVSLVIITFLIHSLRVFLNINFVRKDQTFIAALRDMLTNLPKQRATRLMSIQSVLVVSHVILLSLLVFFVRGPWWPVPPIIFVFQSGLIIWYNWIFDEAIRKDKDKSSQTIIRIMDYITILLSLIIFAVATNFVAVQHFAAMYPIIDILIMTAAVALIGALIGSFTVELIVAYKPAVRTSFRSLLGLIRMSITCEQKHHPTKGGSPDA